ncbi:MAG: membrane protein insertion efficiency factor YidD [Ruminococcus sp.]|uniref:membrane protein insertion efficiency factor YidD n=1 Tax=Ruminococcus sp. TaxID=41978 RepID=UPI0025EB2D2F|nr:membrane protein insertion efficiency factor YidD [Ruminococcus sp.]MCR5601939.1 membrane protein insertion efficiency factor YidD [Ruminococcus sp.]
MKYIVLGLIKFYRKFISPLFPPKCKYYPTCSTYALEAVRRFGAVRGTALAVWRILRCNPWSLGGIDPVPDKFTFRVKKYNFIDPDYGDEDNEKIEG